MMPFMQIPPEDFNPHMHIRMDSTEHLVVADFCSFMFLPDNAVLHCNPRDSLLKVNMTYYQFFVKCECGECRFIFSLLLVVCSGFNRTDRLPYCLLRQTRTSTAHSFCLDLKRLTLVCLQLWRA